MKFVPEIQYGHIMQALAIVLTVGGGVLGAYVSVNARLTTVELQIKTSQEIDAMWRSNVKEYMLSTSTSLKQISEDLNKVNIRLVETIAKQDHVK